MLSNFVKWAVKTYFEDFLEDVDCQQLSLGLLQGHVELSDLTICKKGRLLSKRFPIFIEYGHLDTLTINAPLKLFGNESWYLSVTNLSLNCSCKPLLNEHELIEKHRKDSLRKKFAELARLEDCWKVESLGHAKIPWAELASSLLFQIMRNISVNIAKYRCKITINNDQSVIVSGETVSVMPDTVASARCRKILQITGLQITVQTANDSSFVVCGPVNLSGFFDTASENDMPLHVSWRTENPVELIFSPVSIEIFSKLLNSVAALSEIFRLNQDTILCPVFSHAKLWWRHAFWLISCSLRKFSRIRLQKRLRQAVQYSKAYHQWLKFEYVEIALKKPRDEVEIDWPLESIIHLRRTVLDRFLFDTKRLSEKEIIAATPVKSSSEHPSRSASQGWLQSMSAWVGIGRSVSQPDLQTEPEDLMKDVTPASDEAKKLKEKALVISGSFESFIIIFGSNGIAKFTIQNLAFMKESSAFEIGVSSAKLLFGDVSAISVKCEDDSKLKFVVNKSSQHSFFQAEVNTPCLEIDAHNALMVFPVMAEYVSEHNREVGTSISKLLRKPHGPADTEKAFQPITFDVLAKKLVAKLKVSEHHGILLRLEKFSFQPSHLQPADETQCTAFIDTLILSSLNDNEYFILNNGSCSISQSEGVLAIDSLLSSGKITISPTFAETAAKLAEFGGSLAISVGPLHLSTTQSSLKKPSRQRCVRFHLPEVFLVLSDGYEPNPFSFTISDTKVESDSLSSSKAELSIGSITLNKPTSRLYEQIFISGLPNDESSTFMSFEVDMADNGGILYRVWSLSLADLEIRLTPQFLLTMNNFISTMTSKFKMVQRVEKSLSYPSTPLEIIASIASLNLSLLPFNSILESTKVRVRDVQALRSQSSVWEIAVNHVSMNNEENSIIESPIQPDESCLRFNFHSIEKSLAITMNSVDIFAKQGPILWFAENYVSPILTETSNKANSSSEVGRIVLHEIKVVSQKSRLCLDGDLELSIGNLHHQLGSDLCLSNVIARKTSLDLSLLTVYSISFSKAEREDDMGLVSVVQLNSERVIKLTWSVLSENLLKDVIGTFSSLADKLTSILKKPNCNTAPKKNANLEIQVKSRSFDVAILDPFDPKISIAHLLMHSPTVDIYKPNDYCGTGLQWECNIEAQLVRLADCMYDVVLFECASSIEKSGSRTGNIPLSSSYPGVLPNSSLALSTNYLLKPLPPIPNFPSSNSTPTLPFKLRIKTEKSSTGSVKRCVSVTVENQCSLSLTEKCLPTLLESCGIGAKMFPVLTTADRFGRPIHKLRDDIKASPDTFEVVFSTQTVNCRLLRGDDPNSVQSFASAYATDGVELAFSSVANVHRLEGSFRASTIQIFDDLKEFASLYCCKAIASGLTVEFTKAGLPDYDLSLFSNDVFAKVTTESVSYVHTKRIFVSILDFVDHLMQYRETLARKFWTSQNINIQHLPGHGARLDLQFAFKHPNLVVPMNYASEKSLVIRLDDTAHGSSGFAWQGEKGTNLAKQRAESSIPSLHPRLVAMNFHEPSPSDGSSTFPCLINWLRFDLKGVSVFDGQWLSTHNSDYSCSNLIDFTNYFVEVQQSTSWSSSPICLLVHCERNLDGNMSRNAPDFAVAVLLENLDLDLSREQCTRIFGLLDKNFGEDLGGPPPQPSISSWKNIEVVLYAQGCRVNLFDDDQRELAGVRLDPAALSFSRYSNNSRCIDFKCPEIFVSDIRTISNPSGARLPACMASPIEGVGRTKPMQFELNYSANDNLVRIGFMLSHVRVVVSGDFWSHVVNFVGAITRNAENPASSNALSPEHRTVFAVGDDVISRAPIPQKAVLKSSNSVKISLHQVEICYLLPFVTPPGLNIRGFLGEITAIVVMTPTRSLTLNIPSLKIARLGDGDLPGENVVVMTNFIGDIAHEIGNGNDSPMMGYSPDVIKSIGVLEVVQPPSDMRGELTLGSLRIELNPQLIYLLQRLTNAQNDALNERNSASSTLPAPLVEHRPTSNVPLSALFRLYPELAKLKCSISLIACNLTVDSTPVVMLTFSDMVFEQSLFASLPGTFALKVACRYHNAAVSNWEPLLETWPSQFSWRYDGSHLNEFSLAVTSNEVFNINITSGILELVTWLKNSWSNSSELSQPHDLPDVTAAASRLVSSKPFILVNKLELPLQFSVHPSDYWSSIDSSSARITTLLANPNQEIDFGDDFSPSSSLSLAVKISGYQAIPLPVPVDTVGIVVRSAMSESMLRPGGKVTRTNLLAPTRIIFRVTLNKRRQKVIYAESAVRLINRLPHGLALSFTENLDEDPSQIGAAVTLDTGESVPLPLANIYKLLWFRPLKPGIGFCQQPIIWQNVSQPGLPENVPTSCQLSRPDSRPYHCIVSVIKRQSHFADSSSSSTDPWHVVTISAPIAIRNLLPCDINFELTSSQSSSQLGRGIGHSSTSDRLQSGRTARLTGLDADSSSLTLSVKLDQYPFCTGVSVMVGRSNLFVLDEAKRPLRLTMSTERSRHGVLVIRIECSFWLYNNTNLPLIFRQHNNSLPTMDNSPYPRNSSSNSSSDNEHGHDTIAAGQSSEFEVARSVVPLMFSFDDEEWQFCQMRLGKGLHYPALKPIWSQKFSLVGGTTTRWLFASSSEENYVPERCYVVGLEVEQGRGEYENTTFVTFTARYQIVNHTSFPVCVAQHCLVAKSLPPFDDSGDLMADGIIQVSPAGSMAFHWWRADAESFASVRMVAHGCYWSGSFNIDSPSSFHVNMRDGQGGCHLLHVEIISLGPMNCILLSDASMTPPPYRIDNFSEVPILFNQKGTTADRLRTIVNPKSSIAYALDEPLLPPKIVMSIMGGAASTGVVYDLDVSGEGESLEYENFIYIQLEGSNLVLDIAQDQRRVVFAPQQVGRRSQLWRMTSTGILQNEGVLTTGSHRCLLDIEEHGIDPNRNVLLCLRQQDDRRTTPQTWTFTDDGRLACVPGPGLSVHPGSLPVPSESLELRDAFFGPNPTSNRIVRKRLRPGSGVLCVTVLSDGPTRVLRICDLRATRSSGRQSGTLQLSTETSNTGNLSAIQTPLRLQLLLPLGFGISLVSHTEELAYVSLKQVFLTYRRQPPVTESLRLSVGALQIDNQLLSTPCLVLLFSDSRSKISRRSRRRTTSQSSTELATLSQAAAAVPGPALVVTISRLMSSPTNDVIVFKNLSVSVSRLFIRLEEKFLWKVLLLFGVTGADSNKPTSSMSTSERGQTSGAAQDSRFAPFNHRFSHIVLGRRLYFSSLSIRLNRLDLGMATASAPLPSDLRRIKRAFRVPLIQFTGAQVELETFSRHHVLVTWPLLIAAIKQHYSRGFKSQAGKIFGSVDFLGSPLGLFTDVTEGLSGLIRDANVSGLVRHVMHGLSNSTARFTSAMSETLGSVASDVHYQAERDLIRAMGPSARPADHLVAGLVGFGHGVIGGVTSLFTHTYQGATQQGPLGLITGLGRGVVGTVTRPAAGFLDLAAGAAKAVSETARTSTAPRIMGRIREPRCVSSLNGALAEFSPDLAEAQQFLFTLSSGRMNERLLAMELLIHSQAASADDDGHLHRVAVLVTSDRVYVVRRYADPNSVLQLRYETIRSCKVVNVNGVHHVELLFSRAIGSLSNSASSSDFALMPPEMDAMTLNAEQQRSGYLIRGTGEASAQRIATMINCARQLHDRSKFFVSAAVLLASPDFSSILYGYSGCDFGSNELSEFDS